MWPNSWPEIRSIRPVQHEVAPHDERVGVKSRYAQHDVLKVGSGPLC